MSASEPGLVSIISRSVTWCVFECMRSFRYGTGCGYGFQLQVMGYGLQVAGYSYGSWLRVMVQIVLKYEDCSHHQVGDAGGSFLDAR